MHKTASGERRRALLKEAQRLKREGKLVGGPRRPGYEAGSREAPLGVKLMPLDSSVEQEIFFALLRA